MLVGIHSPRGPLNEWNKLLTDCMHSSSVLCSRTEYTIASYGQDIRRFVHVDP